MDCVTKRTLLLSWQAATRAYSEAVNELAKSVVVLPAEEYDGLKRQTEVARGCTVEARYAFELHEQEHGC
jgi:hypothetical protein